MSTSSAVIPRAERGMGQRVAKEAQEVGVFWLFKTGAFP